jgi:hypothetical protein
LEELLAALPPAPPKVLVGPQLGEDACAIELPRGVLVAATDPVTFTADQIGRWSVVVNANDVAVSGARPRWFLAVVLVPPGTAEAALRELFAEIRDALAALGAHLVGGHTEVTSAVTRPVVVGQMLGLVEDGAVMSSAGAVEGDVVVQMGPVPIEGAAVLARGGRARARSRSGGDRGGVRRFERPGISVVEAALLASVGSHRGSTTRPKEAWPEGFTRSPAPPASVSASTVTRSSGSTRDHHLRALGAARGRLWRPAASWLSSAYARRGGALPSSPVTVTRRPVGIVESGSAVHDLAGTQSRGRIVTRSPGCSRAETSAASREPRGVEAARYIGGVANASWSRCLAQGDRAARFGQQPFRIGSCCVDIVQRQDPYFLPMTETAVTGHT